MKALFGSISLVVALAIVGLIAAKQLKAVGQGGGPVTAGAEASAAPQRSGDGTIREQARELQNRVAGDAVRAMNQGAAGRAEQADKPAEPADKP